VPVGNGDVLATENAGQLTVIENSLVLVLDTLSVTRILGAVVWAVVGVPEIFPAEFMDKPAGKVPEGNVQT